MWRLEKEAGRNRKIEGEEKEDGEGGAERMRCDRLTVWISARRP